MKTLKKTTARLISIFALLVEGLKLGGRRVAIFLNGAALVAMIAITYNTVQAHKRAEQIAAVDKTALTCLATAGFHEARSDGKEGMLATMLVFYERAQIGHRGAEHVCDAVYEPMQASFANSFTETSDDPVLEGVLMTIRKTMNDDVEAKAAKLSKKLALSILLNEGDAPKVYDLLDGADHYLTVAAYNAASDDHWSKHPDMLFIADIGDHKFFRWEG